MTNPSLYRGLLVDRSIWTSLPTGPDGTGYVYVIAFSCNVVKVGKTSSPTARMERHITDARAFAAHPIAVWFSAAHVGYEGTEAALINYAVGNSVGRRLRGEYFYGARYDELVRVAETLAGGESASAPPGGRLETLAHAIDRANQEAKKYFNEDFADLAYTAGTSIQADLVNLGKVRVYVSICRGWDDADSH